MQTIPKHMEWWAKQCWHPWWVWWGSSCMASILGELLCTWATRDYRTCSRLLSAISLFISGERLHHFGGCPNQWTLFAHWVKSEDIRMIHDNTLKLNSVSVLFPEHCFFNLVRKEKYTEVSVHPSVFVYFAGRWAIPWCQGPRMNVVNLIICWTVFSGPWPQLIHSTDRGVAIKAAVDIKTHCKCIDYEAQMLQNSFHEQLFQAWGFDGMWLPFSARLKSRHFGCSCRSFNGF